MFWSVIFILFCITHVDAVSTTVQLSYATYKGETKPNGASQWLGMRYAKPPLGDLRYAAPQGPDTVSGVQSAVQYGKRCLSVGQNATATAQDGTTSEDCLFIDVYAPTSATITSKLPVFFFIQGGGFAVDANYEFNGRGLVAASGNKIVVVTSTYRVGPYGFLAGKEVASANNGLKDQRLAMQWVQNHIAQFGGDPGQVVLGGDSAGAASISIHLAAYGGKTTNLFHAAAAESVSFATVLTVNETQYQFDAFAKSLGCDKVTDKLGCLRSKSVNETQDQNKIIAYPGAPGLPVFSWNPVIDGGLIQGLTYTAYRTGQFIKVPVIFGADTNDGTIFANNCTQTLQQSNNFIRSTFPYINDTQIAKLNELYPNQPQPFPQCGPYWRQEADVYGEMRYLCPGLFLSRAYARYSNTTSAWNYRYNVEDPAQIRAGFGVPHTVEVNAIFGPEFNGPATAPASYEPGQSNAQIVPIIQGYWTSFIRSLDPNTYRYAGTKSWDKFVESKRDRLQFASPPNTTAMETVDSAQWARCEYLWSIGESLRQ